MHLFHVECEKLKWEGRDKGGDYYVFGPFMDDANAIFFSESIVKKNHDAEEIKKAFAYHPKNHLGRPSTEAYLKVYAK